jgi:hypothetical protein
MRSLTILLVLAICFVAGCAREITFRVVDSETGKTLRDVRVTRVVTRSRWHLIFGWLEGPGEIASPFDQGTVSFESVGPDETFYIETPRGYQDAIAATRGSYLFLYSPKPADLDERDYDAIINHPGVQRLPLQQQTFITVFALREEDQ